MVFSSSVFLFIFFPVVLLGYYLLRGNIRNYWLLSASLVFYAWNKPDFLWILFASIFINYCCALAIERSRSHLIRLTALWCCVGLNLALLFYFKYFNFTVSIFESLLHRSFHLAEVILPIGISFFTFQGLSYVVDVYRQDVRAQRNPFTLAMYISLFPQLVAGPIVRYKDVAQEINHRHVTIDDFAHGIRRFILGLFKKIVLADSLAITADMIVSANDYGRNTPFIAWIGIISYSMQLFFDFSGYSDMAIGLGRMFGFHFLENFNYPYISKSITEFWRRWHISLSSFFRDYVYIPLGGNRKHVYWNVAIVFLLTGIWHGASFSFILWGMWHGFFNLAERFFRQRKSGSANKPLSACRAFFLAVLQRIYTLLVVIIGWVFFRVPGIRKGIYYVLSMFGLYNNPAVSYVDPLFYLDRWTICVLILGLFMCTPLPSNLIRMLKGKLGAPLSDTLCDLGLLIMLLLCMLLIASNTYSAFIYFQF